MCRIDAIKENKDGGEITFIPLCPELGEFVGEYTFALKMQDDSMEPELRENDILVIDADKKPKPGCLVAVTHENYEEVIFRRYKQLSVRKELEEYELLAINGAWGKICVNHPNKSSIVGLIINLIRSFN